MADPVIPAAAVAAPAAPEVTQAPVAAPAPTAPAVAAAGVSVIAEPSLLDATPAPSPVPQAEQTPAEKLAAAQAIVEAARLAAQPNSGSAWNLDSATPGQGEKPSWFKADKYKSVAAQAEAYTHLESRLGAFVGAPKDGKYEWKPPENASDFVKGVKFDAENPLFKGFNEWAVKAQLNQDGYNQVLGMLAQYEANQMPDPARSKAEIGENANARIAAVAQWAKANMEAADQAALWDATRGRNAPLVFKTIEALIAKTRQTAMPKPGDDSPSAGGNALAEINALQAARDPKTGKLMTDDPKYRKMVFDKRVEYARANPTDRDRSGQLRG